VPSLWWVLAGVTPVRGRVLFAALVLSIAWVDAHGIHLAANAIGDALAAGGPRDAFYGTAPGELDHWLDEDLGHWEWHLAWVGLIALVVWAALRQGPPSPAGGWSVPALGGALHGITFFFVTTEGGTTLLALPASLILATACARGLRRGSGHPVLRFFLVASVVAIGVAVAWFALNGGRLVEPCAVLHC
jgi:hypothetical protein